MTWTPNEKNAWSKRLWFAKEFGWNDKDLEELPADYGINLIRINNMESKDEAHKSKVAGIKRGKR